MFYSRIQEHPDIIGDELNAGISPRLGGKPRSAKRGGCYVIFKSPPKLPY